MPKLVDTHCHLDLACFDRDRWDVVRRSREAGVCGFVIPAVGRDGWQKAADLVRLDPSLLVCLGIHPCYLDFHDDRDLQDMKTVLTRSAERISGVGETGLDFFTDQRDERKQRRFFEFQIDLAQQFGLPLVLHVRKAHDQVLKCLKDRSFSGLGIVHCFSGSLQQADRYLARGFKLGIGGVVTYERSNRLRRIVAQLPLTSFVLETDAPDIPIDGHQGERNSPEHLPAVFESFAALRPESDDEIAITLMKTVMDLFPKFREVDCG